MKNVSNELFKKCWKLGFHAHFNHLVEYPEKIFIQAGGSKMADLMSSNDVITTATEMILLVEQAKSYRGNA